MLDCWCASTARRTPSLAFGLLLCLPALAFAQATVTTDNSSYAPGETVLLSGSGFAPNETVRVVIHEEPVTHADISLDIQADANGGFTNKPVYLVEQHDGGVTFYLTATGVSSGRTAQTVFTDDNVGVETSAGTATIEFALGDNNALCAASPIAYTGTITASTISQNVPGVGNRPTYLRAAPTNSLGGTFIGWQRVDADATGSPQLKQYNSSEICVSTEHVGGPQRDVRANYAAPPAFDFSITNLLPATRTVLRGSSTTYTFTVTQTAGAAQPITLTAVNLPANTTASFQYEPRDADNGGCERDDDCDDDNKHAAGRFHQRSSLRYRRNHYAQQQFRCATPL
jgi:hypothetical protein